MKRFIVTLCMAIVFGFAVFANADPSSVTLNLFDRGGGLIYDSDLNITWLQDALYAQTSGYDADGLMSWSQARTWAENLAYYDSVRGVTYDDWRLPTTVDGLKVYGYEGDPDGNGLYNYTWGYNLANSEMGHLYYEELGNKGYVATDGTQPQSGWGLSNKGPFINLQPFDYWSDTEYATTPGNAWGFIFRRGLQNTSGASNYRHAWAVRAGDVGAAPVPEPATIVLLIIGLGGVIGMTKLGQQHG